MKTPLFLVLLGVLILGFFVYIYFAFFTKPVIPASFFSSYQEMNVLAKKIVQDSEFDYNALGKSVEQQDLSTARQMVAVAAIKAQRNQAQYKILQEKTTQLKTHAIGITDSSLKQKSLQLFTLIDERNTQIITAIQIETTLFTGMQSYYEAVLQGQKEVQLPNTNQLLTLDLQARRKIGELQFQIDTIYEEFTKQTGATVNTFDPQAAFTGQSTVKEEEIVVPTLSLPKQQENTEVASESAQPAATTSAH